MGYTTDFEGQFHCYHPESKELAVFLRDIRAGDQQTLGPLADWLLDHDDPRGETIARLSKAKVWVFDDFWRLFGLKPEHAAYLNQFSDTRRMKRDPVRAQQLPDPVRKAVGLPLGSEAGYFVGGRGFAGQERDDSIMNYNRSPIGQPGLWCHWAPNANGTAIEWDKAENCYNYVELLEWLQYLLTHFLRPWGYLVNGTVTWQCEEDDDRGSITVRDNVVKAKRS